MKNHVISIKGKDYLFWHLYGKYILSSIGYEVGRMKKVKEFMTEKEAKNYIKLMNK